MERALVQAAPTPLSLGLPGSGFTKPGNLALEILMGTDEEIRPEDVLIGASHSRALSLSRAPPRRVEQL